MTITTTPRARQRYTTRSEAIYREIILPIEIASPAHAHADEYHVDRIADAVLGGYSDGYARLIDDDDTFWAIIKTNAH